MNKLAYLLAATLLLTSCTSFKVVELNPETGYFPTSNKAELVTSVETDLDSMKQLIVVPSNEFTGSMIKNINYFDQVITIEDLEEEIIKNNLTDEVPSLDDRIGLNKAAKHYRFFLWLRWDDRRDGNKKYIQMKLINPLTLEEYMVSETYLDYAWAGVNDQMNWYPMMNSLIEYIEKNSKTYKNKPAEI